MKRILTTVGTSLIKHLQKEGMIDQDRVECLEKDRNKREKYKKHIDAIKEVARDYLIKKDLSNNDDLKKMSAELKSIQKIISYDKLTDFIVDFIYTDTLGGEVVTEILEDYLTENKNFNGKINKQLIEGLKIDNRTIFERQGIPNLIEYIIKQIEYDEVTGNFYSGNLILNITGGFKAVVPYLTLMGNIYEIPVYYIFEDTDELIILPPVPVNYDEEFFDKYKKEINQIDREGLITEDKLNELFEGISWEERERVKTRLLQQDSEEVDCYYLNPIAHIFWKKFSKNYLFNIYLSDEAKKFYNDKRKRAVEILKKVSNYQLRNSEKHMHNIKGTDLCCYKHSGDCHFRVMYKVDDNQDKNAIVKVAEIFDMAHSEGDYDAFVKTPKSSSDYNFEPVIIPLNK